MKAIAQFTITQLLDGEDAAFASPYPPSDKTKLWLDTSVEPNVLKQWNGTAWVRINDDELTELKTTTTELNTSIVQTKEEITQSITDKTTVTIDGQVVDVNEQTSTLTNKVDGLEQKFKTSGGNNLILDSMGAYQDGWTGNYAVDSGVDIKNKNMYGYGLLLMNATLEQTVQVPNGKYTIYFEYIKRKSIANCTLLINGQTFILSNTAFTELTHTFDVTSGSINIKFICNTDNSCSIVNLMLNQGIEPMKWSLNPNETWSTSVKISQSGIIIEVVANDTALRMKNDIIGFFNKKLNKYVATFTDVGMEVDEIVIRNKMVSCGVLWKSFTDHTFLSYVGE